MVNIYLIFIIEFDFDKINFFFYSYRYLNLVFGGREEIGRIC